MQPWEYEWSIASEGQGSGQGSHKTNVCHAQQGSLCYIYTWGMLYCLGRLCAGELSLGLCSPAAWPPLLAPPFFVPWESKRRDQRDKPRLVAAHGRRATFFALCPFFFAGAPSSSSSSPLEITSSSISTEEMEGHG